MIVKYKGKKTVFDVKAISNLSYDEFNEHCLSLSTFKLMPEKQRIAKIKEMYDNLGASKERKESVNRVEESKDIRQGDTGKGKGNFGQEPGTVNTGEKHKKPENKAEIHKRKIRKEKGTNES